MKTRTRYEMILLVKIGSRVCSVGLFKKHYVKKDLLLWPWERRQVIFHPHWDWGEALSNPIVTKCGLWVIVPNFIFIALIVFGWRDPENWVFPFTSEVTFTTALLWQITIASSRNSCFPCIGVKVPENLTRYDLCISQWQRQNSDHVDYEVVTWLILLRKSYIVVVLLDKRNGLLK